MDHFFRSGLILLAGIAALVTAFAFQAILLETVWTTVAVAAAGAVLTALGAFQLRTEIGLLFARRRSESALFSLGVVGVLLCVAFLSARFPLRFDMTEAGLHSLSTPTVAMLRSLERPVHIVFFHFLGNGNLFLNTVGYLTARKNLIGVEPRTYDLPRLSVTNRQMKGTFVLSMALVPGLLALVGIAVWWRQR